MTEIELLQLIIENQEAIRDSQYWQGCFLGGILGIVFGGLFTR